MKGKFGKTSKSPRMLFPWLLRYFLLLFMSLLTAAMAGEYSITVSAAEWWSKIQKELKVCYLKICPPIKLKQLSLIFILNHISNSFYHVKI